MVIHPLPLSRTPILRAFLNVALLPFSPHELVSSHQITLFVFLAAPQVWTAYLDWEMADSFPVRLRCSWDALWRSGTWGDARGRVMVRVRLCYPLPCDPDAAASDPHFTVDPDQIHATSDLESGLESRLGLVALKPCQINVPLAGPFTPFNAVPSRPHTTLPLAVPRPLLHVISLC